MGAATVVDIRRRVARFRWFVLATSGNSRRTADGHNGASGTVHRVNIQKSNSSSFI